MRPDERTRAGAAVGQRIADRSTTLTAVTRTAGIDPKTLRALISGARWPTAGVRARVEIALQWPPGEILRRTCAPERALSPLSHYTSTELLAEVLHRATERERRERFAPQGVLPDSDAPGSAEPSNSGLAAIYRGQFTN